MRRGAKAADVASRKTTMDEVVAYITGAKGERSSSAPSLADGAQA
jgi:hypothetical protein